MAPLLSKIQASLLNYSYAAALGASLSRSTTPDPQHVARALSPCPPPIGQGRVSTSEERGTASSNSFIGVSSGTIREPSELVEQGVDSHQNYLFGLQGGRNHLKQNTYMKNSESGHLHLFCSSICQ
ncbi:hypothetical protein NC651_006631 [Populus alba x Populus x berolinensis]|nr:hypothetical protein NC651_006631 [Populus alba x Populus x berolinensis]